MSFSIENRQWDIPGAGDRIYPLLNTALTAADFYRVELMAENVTDVDVLLAIIHKMRIHIENTEDTTAADVKDMKIELANAVKVSKSVSVCFEDFQKVLETLVEDSDGLTESLENIAGVNLLNRELPQ